jgi:replicative DNA helicase
MSKQNREEMVEKNEKKFLAYCMENVKYTSNAIQEVAVEDLKLYQDVYAMIGKYYKKYSGIINKEVVHQLFKTGNITSDLVIRFESLYTDTKSISVIDFADFKFCIDQILMEKNRRIMLSVAENIIDNVGKVQPDEQKIKAIEDIKKLANTANINRAKQQNVVNLYDNVKSIVEEMTSESQLQDAVVPSGFKCIDEQSGGFRKGELVYVVGRKGDGKSVTLLNFAHNAVVEGKNVIYFSLEMSALMCQRRYLSRATQEKMLDLKNGKMDMNKIKDFAIKGKKKQQNSYDGKEWKLKENIGTFFVVESAFSMTTASIDTVIESKEQELGIIFDTVIVDYAGIMSASAETGAERRHQQGQVALELKRLALQRNVVTISAAQMNREGAKKKEAVSTANIAESDQIADHCDWVIAVYTHDEDPQCAVMSTIKVRDGEAFTKRMKKSYETMSLFEEYSVLEEWE